MFNTRPGFFIFIQNHAKIHQIGILTKSSMFLLQPFNTLSTICSKNNLGCLRNAFKLLIPNKRLIVLTQQYDLKYDRVKQEI